MASQKYPIEKIAFIVEANAYLTRKDDDIQYLLFDSRRIEVASLSLFFALESNRDGHDFVIDAYRKGVRNFVVKKSKVSHSTLSDANILEVEDPLSALRTLAAFHRSQFSYPVIAITGSNGKTVVKDWLYQLLSPDYKIIRSPKSFNSQIGTALSLWQMSDEYNLAIIEAGISQPGEMDSLEKMIRPSMGVITNVKKAHFENFKSKKEKVLEKMKLFQGADLLIYSPEYINGDSLILPQTKVFSWAYEVNADLKIENRTMGKGGVQAIRACYREKDYQIQIPFQDEASTENAVICWSVLLSFGVDPLIIQERMWSLAPVKMRLEMKQGLNNCTIIDDSYSCDISSLAIALDFLQQQKQHDERTLILSDIPEIGKDKEKTYKKVAELLENKGVDRLIAVGDDLKEHAALFKANTTFFSNTEDFLKAIHRSDFKEETILIKGARSFSFEKISNFLASKIHETALEIDLNALENNLRYYKGKLKPQTKLMVMVKAFSYGSGSYEIANILQFNQVDYLAVAYADEGITLRAAGIKLPIMVMSSDSSSFESMIEHNLEPEIYSFELLYLFIALLSKKGITSYPVHIKLDTGMHRLGFETNDLDNLVELLKNNQQIKVASVFSHFAAADDPSQDEFSKQQLTTLCSFTDNLSEELGYSFMSHIANTAAITRFPAAEMDMVRLGIGLYGINRFVEDDNYLERVATLKTTVSQVKQVGPHDSVGYGRKGRLPRGGQIATVKIGYADGYSRRFGNGVAKMMVRGHLVPTIGDICMDMCMLDVSNIQVKEGDEVTVFGLEPRIEELAKKIDTIPYEILAGISQRVKRVYFYE